jgi:glucose/arabinose dehydrogenase
MPTAKGWIDGQLPVAAPGLKVNAFATGLKHPRWIHVLPNAGVLVAGTGSRVWLTNQAR